MGKDLNGHSLDLQSLRVTSLICFPTGNLFLKFKIKQDIDMVDINSSEPWQYRAWS